MMVERSKEGLRIRTQQEQPENSCRPSVDVLFRSVAEVYQGDALAVIMTGMGQDGLRGCGRIREGGGQILAQDEATSVVWGMPGYVANAGLADAVLPLGLIAGEIVRRVAVGRVPAVRPRLSYFLDSRSAQMSVTPNDFEYVRALIHQRAGIVLEQGKEYLVESRLGPLAEKEGFGSLGEYLGRLQRDTFNGSHRKLIHAMTINETLFFRDIRPFELLRTRIIPDTDRRSGKRALPDILERCMFDRTRALHHCHDPAGIFSTVAGMEPTNHRQRSVNRRTGTRDSWSLHSAGSKPRAAREVSGQVFQSRWRRLADPRGNPPHD